MVKSRASLLALFTAAVLCLASRADAAIPTAERNALIALYNSTNGPGWTNSAGWLGAPGSECNWAGVDCDAGQSTVLMLRLSYNNLVGTIPPEIGSFPNLTVLELIGNTFTGTIPSQIGSDTKLQQLFLDQAGLSGSIPSTVASLTALKTLSLGDNSLSGTIPQGISQLTALEGINLTANQLEGSLPSFSALTNMTFIAARGNKLTGAIPDLRNSTKLDSISLGDNQLTGQLPALSSLPVLRDVYLSYNQLEGQLPADIGRLRSLRTLQLSGNKLTGTIPTSIGDLPALTIFDLGGNQLTGTIPTELGKISTLKELYLAGNPIAGQIPDSLGNLSALEILYLQGMTLSGPIPATLGKLSKLRELYLFASGLEGTIPVELGQLGSLQQLILDDNKLTGSLPASIGNLSALTYLSMASNQLSGPLPADFGRLTRLDTLEAEGNLLTGSIPVEVGNLRELVSLRLGYNQFSGTLPTQISQLTKLETLQVTGNDLTGTLPDVRPLTKLLYLFLGQNRFSGSIPAFYGSLTSLLQIDLGYNALSGVVPPEITNLMKLEDGNSDFGYNALFTNNATVRDFLNRKQGGGDWESTQTTGVTNVRVTAVKGDAIVLTWDRPRYLFDEGGYEVSISTNAAGPASRFETTFDKTFSSINIDKLQPSTTYFFTVRTVTYEHDPQRNVLTSDPSPVVSATTTVGTPTPAQVVVSVYPFGIVQSAGVADGTDYVLLANVGDADTTLTVATNGNFFTAGGSSIPLPAGGEYYLELKGLALPSGAYSGTLVLTGDGTPAGGLKIPVRLLSVGDPGGTPVAQAVVSRVDLASPAASNPSGTVAFKNIGTGTLSGIVVSNVPWIIPPTDLVTIGAGQTATVAFTIDRTQRPDASQLSGTETGTLSLIYVQSAGAARTLTRSREGLLGTPGVASSLVTIVDTVQPMIDASSAPPISPGEVALFVPGVGHVTGGVGLFLSDISIANTLGASRLTDMKAFFTASMDATAANSSASLSTVESGEAIKLADVVKNVFTADQVTGTVQIRTSLATKLFVNATIFNVSNPAGTYGSTIPVFRSDRAVAPGASMYLTGLRKTATMRTNLFVQETTGNNTDIQVDFIDAEGSVLGSINATVNGFKLLRLLDRVPAGAVTAKIVNLPASRGRIVAYATPVDQASGDFWAVVDWNQLLGSDRTEIQIIPIAGSARGANDTFFRTDAAIFNSGTKTAAATLSYYQRDGTRKDSLLSLDPQKSRTFEDIVGGLFGAPTGSLGYLVFDPSRGSFATMSRTFATVGSAPGSLGTGVPTLPLSSALRRGQSRTISGLDVSSLNTIQSKKPGTFRTNLGLIETEGNAATVRVSVLYGDGRSLVYGPIVTFTVTLKGHEFQLLSDLSTRLAAVKRTEDLHDVGIEFDVVDGAAVVYVSSIDNGSGDSLLRTE
ncbi:MAG TPA: fibronectin type III domain-containing protein [Thermoanaerobaculia bacterium]|nr:fibronectin type III domain-containing protein [Thermoanaerobaculia bacterium]